jgi:hypothetical protein
MRPTDNAQLSRPMKSLTPKEWKAQNEQKIREAASKAFATASDHQAKGVYVRPGTAATANTSHSSEHVQASSSEPNLLAGYSRKRELSDPEQPARQAPALRQPSPLSAATTSQAILTSTAPSAAVAPPVPKPVPRPAAKPKTSNLFIPRKPVSKLLKNAVNHDILYALQVKRPLPPDAPYPDAKRKPT